MSSALAAPPSPPRAVTFAERATRYARDVHTGAIPGSLLTRLAAERHLGDLARAGSASFLWTYDERRVERVCRFAELMPHIKGEWAKRKERIRLEDWQVFILASIFGWVHRETGQRRFRTAYVEVPRKNAKSTLGAIILLYMLVLDGEEGAECFTAATTRDQARIVFKDACAMVRKTPELQQRYGVVVEKHQILVPGHNSFAAPITREQSANEGLNVHLGLCDELHAHKTPDVYEVLDQGKGARLNPLLLSITTAGSNLAGICYQVRQMVVLILRRQAVSEELERVFGLIYTIDEDDDPSGEVAWRKANPNFGVSVYPDDMADAHAKAAASPARWNEFLTKRLNVWVQAGDPYFDATALRTRCLAPELVAVAPGIPEEFDGRRCFVGIDLATRRDLAALVVVFPEDAPWDELPEDVRGRLGEQRERVTLYTVFGRYYLPAATIETARNAAYPGWVRDGWIVETPGETTDFAFIKRDLLEWAERFDVLEVPFDPREARQLATELLNDHGLEMVEFRQGYSTYNEPMKAADVAIVQGAVRHNGDPVFLWAMGNVVGKQGAYGDVMPDHDTEAAKIDPASAFLMAFGRAIVHVTVPSATSVYEERGFIGL